MTYTTVVFDLDGTLLDTLPDIAAAGNEVLEAVGAATYAIDEYRTLVGAGVGMLFQRALPPDRQDEQTVNDCVARFFKAYHQHWNVRTRAYDGITELLDALVQRNLKLAVLSNKPDLFTKQCIAEFLGQYPFDPVFGQREGVPRKPDPTSALEICEHLQVAPASVLYVGDTAIDMQTANRAGMFAVGVTWGLRSRQELSDNDARILIDDPRELMDLL